MKLNNLAVMASLLVCLVPSLAVAQAKIPDSGPPKTVSSAPVTIESLQQMRINSFDLSGVDSSTALTTLLKTTHVSYDFAPEFYKTIQYAGQGKPALNLPQRTITLRMDNVRFTRALDSLTKAIGIEYTMESEDNNVIIHFIASGKTLSELENQSGHGGGGLGGGGFGGGGFGGGGFGGSGQGFGFSSNERVKVDVRDAPVRDVLKTLFAMVKPDENLSFAVDEDVTPDTKVSLTFDNVRITTAIEVLSQSAGLGWHAEQTPTGILIRISKRYAPPSSPQ